jgi:hypothetical protein
MLAKARAARWAIRRAMEPDELPIEKHYAAIEPYMTQRGKKP